MRCHCLLFLLRVTLGLNGGQGQGLTRPTPRQALGHANNDTANALFAFNQFMAQGRLFHG